jgi:hypothetical protein
MGAGVGAGVDSGAGVASPFGGGVCASLTAGVIAGSMANAAAIAIALPERVWWAKDRMLSHRADLVYPKRCRAEVTSMFDLAPDQSRYCGGGAICVKKLTSSRRASLTSPSGPT